MKPLEQFHCPHCKARIAIASADSLRCKGCDRVVNITDGIIDFVGGSTLREGGSDHYRGDPRQHDPGRVNVFSRIQIAASDRWPTSLGDTIAFGCGRGETTHAIAAGQTFRSLLVLDTEIAMLQACRSRIGSSGAGSSDQPIAYATLSGAQDVLCDAVADTVIGTGVLPGINDVRVFLAMVYRVLKPNGRAIFVVPNRRYYEAMCLAMAEALVQRHARDGVWPEGQSVALELLAQTRRLLVHKDDLGFLSGLEVKHLFDSDLLEDLGGEVGFSTAEMIPLELDPVGAETMYRICQDAGAPESFTETFGALAAAVGQPFFNLLNRQDSSASMLFWLTKGHRPVVRIFTHRPSLTVGKIGADAALGGVAPRWSVELLARDTAAGIVVSVGGWCLCNTDVLWIRLTLDETTRYAPVWRPRPDVHEVLNRSGVYHPLNTLCSGITSDLLFENVHATDGNRTFRLDIILANGLIVSGPAPEVLMMDEQMVIAH